MIIKLNRDKSLSVTKTETVFEMENLASDIRIICPKDFPIDIAKHSVVMNLVGYEDRCSKHQHIDEYHPFIDIVQLEQIEDYNSDYYQYQVVITSKYTFAPLHYKLWLTIIDYNNEMVMKSGDAYFRVTEKDLSEEYLSENQLSLLDQWLIKMEEMYNNSGGGSSALYWIKY